MFEVALQYIKYYVSDSIIKIKKFSSLQQQTKMYIKSTYLLHKISKRAKKNISVSRYQVEK